MIYEIVGPLMTREALTAAGNIRPNSEEIIKRRANKLAAVGSPRAAQAEAIAEETIKEEAEHGLLKIRDIKIKRNRKTLLKHKKYTFQESLFFY